MKNWKRIILVVLVLIGGTASFSYWSISQFDQTFDSLGASHIANVASVHSAYTLAKRQKTDTTLSSEGKVLGESATSTENVEEAVSTSTTETSEGLDIVTKPELSFIFPQENDEIYIGCTYQISWESSGTVASLEAVLVDAITGEHAGPVRSGIAKENTIDGEQKLEWKVGAVWPGWYYIEVPRVNGAERDFKSNVFEISKTPEGNDCEGLTELPTA